MTPPHASDGISPEVSLTRLAARRLRSIASGQFSPEVREKVVVCLVDYHGAVQTGLSTPWSATLIKYATTRPGPAEAHAWGTKSKVSAEIAAFFNAALAHRYVHPFLDSTRLDSLHASLYHLTISVPSVTTCISNPVLISARS